MPAMSPTMTEGNIASWKVKEGDSFSSGDVLLEIETDKASMDVEAQDDGIMAKIFQGDGSKAVQVGTRIAVIAESGDDISSLQIPEDTSVPVSSPADNMKKATEEQQTPFAAPKGTPENKRPDRDRPKTSPDGPGQNPKYPLYPAVQALVLAKGIPEKDALNIPATGPGGRLLKGDVLAYLGNIEADYSKSQSARIEQLGHLDLSNIKVAPKADAAAPTGSTTGPAVVPDESAVKEQPKITSVSITVSLAEVLRVQKRVQETLGTTMPLSAFLARAVDQANDDLPLPKGVKPSSNDLFNAVLGLNRVATTSRGTYLPQITALPSASASPAMPKSANTRPIKKPVDIIDILSGKAKPARSVAGRATLAGSGPSAAVGSAGAINIFSLNVPVGEEKRARTFLERMKTVLQVEPGRLVL
ncbi:pyridoxine biosynthesis protein [Knufia obscura]|uniref:Pyridoxine biosynthesis protein n=2 Tax=Knufia TaxID=430999 RepID=A0AAN8F3R9_9EURO|nr:pyridoxine biosynthesis protein [Knufia obscura]KAK5950651.1 pyridoxine biosynthesis protein [Knufia fluminis]